MFDSPIKLALFFMAGALMSAILVAYLKFKGK